VDVHCHEEGGEVLLVAKDDQLLDVRPDLAYFKVVVTSLNLDQQILCAALQSRGAVKLDIVS
jgi:phosphoribosyl-ATP pyrophosphohydrolase